MSACGSAIREVKNIGGLDTVGIETGEGIIKRARSELSQVVGNKRAQELVDIPVHINDAEQVWWTPMTAYDNDRDQQIRVREFITFMRYSGDTLPIFVGHSLFFKAFYSKRISKQLAKNRRQLSHDLQKFRLSNCSMLAVVVTFYDVANGSSEAKLVDADLIFGGGFHGNPNYRNSLERKASLTLSEERALANVPGTSPNNKFLGTGGEDDQDNEHRNSSSEPAAGGGIFINRRRSGSSAPEREPRNSIVNGIEGFFSAFPSNFAAKKDALTKELTKGAKKFTDKVSEVSDKLHDIFEK
ncbi:hypothetical protein EON65_20280 [archaeon]|nr:MAG: hypothetical protein EON65_20280 [archaeon]